MAPVSNDQSNSHPTKVIGNFIDVNLSTFWVVTSSDLAS